MNNYTHLSMNDRQRLYTYLEMGVSIKTISQKLSRHHSTLYKEINRNKEFSKYLPGIANQKAASRASNGRISKLQHNGYLRDYVVKALKKGWSPEQVSGRMKYQKLTIYVCPETIYQYVYKSKNMSNIYRNKHGQDDQMIYLCASLWNFHLQYRDC